METMGILGKMPKKVISVGILGVLCAIQSIAAQTGFFFDLSGTTSERAVAVNTATPAVIGGILGVGYSIGKFDVSAEGGITGSREGDNPRFSGVEKEVSGNQIPITIKGSYDILTGSRFKLKPELFMGLEYTDPDLVVKDGLAEPMEEWALLGGIGFRVGYLLSDNSLLYLGGYVDYRLNMEDMADSDRQSANFQLRAGVQMHPLNGSGSGGGGMSTKASRTTRTVTRAPAARGQQPSVASQYPQSPTGAPAGASMGAPMGGSDSVLLSALRMDSEGARPAVPLTDTRTPNSLTYVLREKSELDAAMSGNASLAQAKPAPAKTAAAKPAPATSAAATPAAATSADTKPAAKQAQKPAAAKNFDTAALKQDIAALKAEVIEMNKSLKETGGTEAAKASATAPASAPAPAAPPPPAASPAAEVATAPATAPAAAKAQPATAKATATATTESIPSGTVYYSPNETKLPIVYSIPTLDAVGKKLQESGGMIVIVRGYAAAAGTTSGQNMVSEQRAKYCADYLNQKWDIPYDRMEVEWYGATQRPELSEEYKDETFNRAVDLVLVQK
jgi:outer membrane protein OmpA-like peptidoglycan-associated protein